MVNPLDNIIEMLTNNDRVRGDKVAELSAQEMNEWQANQDRGEDFGRRMNALLVEQREIQLSVDKWWLKIRQTYKINNESLEVVPDEMAVYERVKKSKQAP